jgi:CBS domain-containing protein
MKVKDVMVKDPVKVQSNITLYELQKIFDSVPFWTLFVIENEKLVGVVTRNDLLKRGSILPLNSKVYEIMSKPYYKIKPNADIGQAERALNKHNMTSLPVVDENDNLIGVIGVNEIDPKTSYIIDENNYKKVETGSSTFNIRNVIFALFIFFLIISFFTNLIYPLKRPIYFYDLDPNCVQYNNQIISGIEKFSDITNIKFVRIPFPLGYISGGNSYYCDIKGSYFLGEHESNIISGGSGLCIIIIHLNKIKLYDLSEETIFHETLHSMGFDHSENKSSIMYPYQRGYSDIDSETISNINHFINEPLILFNILTFNLIYLFGFLFIYLDTKFK